MKNEEILDRLELIYSTNKLITDLRKAVVSKDIHSLFRITDYLISDKEFNQDLRKAVIENNLHSLFRLFHSGSFNVEDIDGLEDLRKAVLNDDSYALFRLLKFINNTPIIESIKKVNDLENFNQDALSQGQVKSKIWLVEELEKLNLDLGTIFLCAGWYATLASMLFESKCKIDKIRSFDIDNSCCAIAEKFNKPYVLDNWKFKATTFNIQNISYPLTYSTKRSDNTLVDITEDPDTIINTSCEHIEHFTEWFDKIPEGKIVILQTNNFFEIEDHINCSNSLKDFSCITPLKTVLFSGELNLAKYTRYMRIGVK